MRLIDADAFVNMMEEKCDMESTIDPWVLSVCRGGVKMMPTVDAVPVVRCKNCKHNQLPSTSANADCEIFYGMTDQNGFCHKAERRTE